jgi:hypothetical protein
MNRQTDTLLYKFGSIKVKNTIDSDNARMINVGDPINTNDAANKKYVDDRISFSEMYAGTGLTKTDTTFSVNNSLTHVTAIGNINTGTWSANTINVPYGGTGKSSFTANKLVMGDGTNPLISISQVSFESNKLKSTAPIEILNTTNSSGVGSGGSFTTLGGASVSGKLWLGDDLSVKNNVYIQGDITVGNLTLNGTANFGSVSANNSTYTNCTITNIISTNITTSSIITTQAQTTNITNSNLISTNITNTNLHTTNISASTLNITNYINSINLSLSNISTSTLLTTQSRSVNTTTTNLLATNLSGSSAILSNLTAPSIVASSVSSVYTNVTNGTFTSITTDNIIVNTTSVLTNTTTSNLFNVNFTSSNIQNVNLRTTNATVSTLLATTVTSVNTNVTNITTNNVTTVNITTNNVLTTNLTTSNISTTNLLSQNISSSTLRISGVSILSTINSNNLSTGTLSVTGQTTLTNTIMTNSTISNISNNNITTTNITTSNVLTNNISTSNLNASNIVVLGSVGSVNLSTGNIHSSSTAVFNNSNIITSTISNLRVTGVSILGTVNSNNISTGSINISNSLNVPLVNNTTQTTTNLLVSNVRATNITSTTLQITGTSIFTTVTSNNINTGTLAVSTTATIPNIIATNITAPNISTSAVSTSIINISNTATISKTLNIGSNFSASPKTSSGNILNIVPGIFTDSTTLSGGTVPLWAANYFANPTLSAQNTITTQKISNIYIQGDPIVGINQTVENSAAVVIGYVGNQTGGNMSGQIILERGDGNWYGSIFTEATTNKIVIANASLSGGGGIGLYTYTGTKVTFADIPSATEFTPTTFLEFSNDQSTFYSTTESINTTTGSVVLYGGLGVEKNISCNSITPVSINASISSLQDVDSTTPTTGQSLVWNGSQWSPATISGGGGGGNTSGSIGPVVVEVYPMELVMPVMTSNGPVEGNDGDYYVSASSEFSALYTANKCLSSITNPSDWATAGEVSDFWIKVQLPVSQNVRYILLEGRINNEDPNFVTIQGSNDDITYTDIYLNENFTALNYNGYFSARIPENSKDYLYYKFFFASGAGVNPGLNMLRLFRHDVFAYSEGILDNSAVEGNGKFTNCIINGRWPMSFDLDTTTIVNIRAQITCYTSSSFVLRKFVMYVDGAPFSHTGSTFVKQVVHQNLHLSLQTLEWTGTLDAGIHTLSFFVDGGTGIVFDTLDTIRVNIVKY